MASPECQQSRVVGLAVLLAPEVVLRVVAVAPQQQGWGPAQGCPASGSVPGRGAATSAQAATESTTGLPSATVTEECRAELAQARAFEWGPARVGMTTLVSTAEQSRRAVTDAASEFLVALRVADLPGAMAQCSFAE